MAPTMLPKQIQASNPGEIPIFDTSFDLQRFPGFEFCELRHNPDNQIAILDLVWTHEFSLPFQTEERETYR